MINSGYFDGKIDDVRIYNRALSATEITDLAAGKHTTATWDGSSSTNYETAANWDTNAIPDPYTIVVSTDQINEPVLTANIQVGGLTINASSVFDLASFNLTNNDSGTFAHNGTFRLQGGETVTALTMDTDSGTWEYVGDGTGAATTQTVKEFGATDYYHLTINDASASNKDTFKLGAALAVAGNLTITAGTLDVSVTNYGIAVTGNFSNAGTFTAQSGVVTFNATDTNNTINPGASSLYGLTFNGVGGAWDLSTNLLTVTNALTITNGTFDLNGVSLTATGATFSNAGTLRLAGGETVTGLTMDVDSGTVEYDGGSAYTGLKAGNSYYHLTFNGAGSWTLGAALDVNGLLTLTAGTLAVSASNYQINVAGGWTDTGAGALTEGAGTVVLDGAGTVNSNEPFNHVTVNMGTSNLTVTGTLDVNGDLTITAVGNIDTGTIALAGSLSSTDTAVAGTAAVTLDGSGAQTITTGTGQLPTGTFTVNKSAGTATLAANLVLGTSQGLTITAGTLDQGASYNLACGALTVSSGATLKNIGSGDLTLGGTLDNAGTVQLDSGGGGTGHDDADTITLTSSAAAQRTLQGGGTWTLIDLNVSWMAKGVTPTTLTVTGGTDSGNNTGITFAAGTATRTWDGGGGVDTNWNTAANWSGDTAPVSTDIVAFDGVTSNNNCTVNVAVSVAGVHIHSNYTGTITQNASITVTVGTSNYNQEGGTFTGSAAAITVNGNYTLSGGTFTSTSGDLTADGDFTISGGTFTHNSGTVIFGTGNNNKVIDINVSLTLNNLTINKGNSSSGVALATNDTLTVTGTLALTRGYLDGGGTVDAQGDVTHGANFSDSAVNANQAGGNVSITGTATRTVNLTTGGFPNLTLNAANVTVNGPSSGTLTFGIEGVGLKIVAGTFTSGAGDITVRPRFEQTGGTFTAPSGTLTVNVANEGAGAGFVISGGTFTHNSGTIKWNGFATCTANINSTLTLNHFTISMGNEWSIGQVNTSDTVTVTGTLTLDNGKFDAGGGTLNAEGNVVVNAGFDGGTGPISFTGTANQTYTDNGGNEPDGDLTINKSAGTVTLGSNADWNASGQDLTITAGTLDQGASYNLACGALTVSSGATLKNLGSGDLTLGGTLDNAGTVQLDSAGGGTGHNDPDTILLRSSVAATQRTLQGGGTWTLIDVDVKDMARGTTPASLTVTGGTDTGNNTGITFAAGTATRTWDGGGGVDTNWNTAANWSGDTAPVSTDIVAFDGVTSNNNCTINVAASVAGVHIHANYTGTITQNAGITVTVGSSNYSQEGGTFTGGNSTIDINGAYSLSGGTFTSTSGTMNVGGNFTRSGGTFTHNSGTVLFDATGTLNNTQAFNHLTVNGSGITVTLGSALDVNGTLTLTAGTLDVGASNYQINVAGGWTDTGTGAFTEGSGTVVFDGTGTLNSNEAFNHVTINTTGTVTLGAALDVNGTLTLTTGTLDVGASNYQINVAVGWTDAGAGAFTEGGGTVVFDGAQTVNSNEPFNHVTVDMGANNLTVTGTLDVNGNLTITNVGNIDTGTVAIAGNLTSTDTTVAGTAAITLDGAGAQTITASLSAEIPDGTFTIDKSADVATLASNFAANAVGQDLTINAGTLDLASYNLTVNDVFTLGASGTLRLQGGETVSAIDTVTAGSTVIYNGTGSYTTSLAAGNTYHHLTFNGTGGVWEPSGAVTVNGNLTITAGTFDIDGQNLSVTGTFSNTGTLRLTGGETTVSLTMDTDSGTVEYDGGVAYTGLKAGNAYYHLTFNGAGAWTLGAALDVNGLLTLTAGTLDASASNYQINVAGGWTDAGAGAFTEQAGTVVFDGTQTVNANEAFNSVTVNISAGTVTLGAALTATGNVTITAGTLDVASVNNYGITVGGNWSNSGTFTARSGTVTFNATDTDNTINPGSSSFYGMTFNGVGGAWDLSTNALTATNALTITNGTFDLNSVNLTATNATFSNDGTFRLAGGETITGLTMDTNSGTVTYDGGGTYTSLLLGNSYNHLTMNGAGSWTLGAALDVNGLLTLTAGTLNVSASNYQINVGGGWTDTGAAVFTKGSGTVVFDGTGTVNGNDQFHHVTVNAAGITATLGGALSAAGDVTITDGKLDVSSSNLTVTGTLTINKNLDQGAGNITAGTISVGAAGSWLNQSTGDLTVGSGGVANSGSVRFDANGGGGGSADSILIRSSATPTQRAWSGTGTFILQDIDVQDQAGTATITVYNGTNTGNNGTNWTFDAANGPYRIWDGGGADNNWNTAANWSSDTAPATTELVTFDATSTKSCTVNANVNVSGITINAGYTGTITQNAAVTVTLGADNYTQAAGTFTGGDSTIDISGGKFTLSAGTFTATSGTMEVTGNFTVSGGTFTHNSGTVTLDGTANQTADIGSVTLNNMTINKSSTTNLTVTGSLDVNGTLTITQVQNITGTILAGGGVTTTDTAVGGAGVVKTDGAGNQTIAAGGGTGALPNLTIDKSAGTLTVSDTINVADVLTITAAGDINTGPINVAGNVTSTDAAVTGTSGITLNGTAGQTITATNADLPDGTLTINKSAGTATLGSAVSVNAVGQDLTITAGTLDLASYNLTVNDVLTVGASGTLQLQGGETVSKTTFTPSASSTVIYNGGGAYTGLAAGSSYHHLTFNGAGSWTLGANLDVNGNLTITSGTLDASTTNYGITLAGNWSNAGTFTPRSGTVTLDAASGTQTVNSGGTGAGKTFYHLTHGGAGTLQTVTNNLKADGNLALSAGAGTFDNATNDKAITVVGNVTMDSSRVDLGDATWTVSGSWDHVDVTTFNRDLSTVVLDGASKTLTMKAGSTGALNNVTISGTVSSAANGTVYGTTTVSGTLTVNTGITYSVSGSSGALSVSSGGSVTGVGTLDLASGAQLTGQAGTIDVSTLTFTDHVPSIAAATYASAAVKFGGMTNSLNYWRFGAGTVTFNGNVELNGAGSAGTGTLDNATNNPSFVLKGNVVVTEPLGTITWTKGTGTITLSSVGSGTQTYNFFGKSIEAITVNDSGATKQLTGNVTTTGLTVTAGTFDLNGKTFGFAASAAASNLGTIKLVGSETLTNVTSLDIDSGTVLYAGASTYTSLAGGHNYYHLTFNNATGSWTHTGALDVNGTLTITAGTLISNGQNVNVAGNWSNAGTYTSGSNAVTFDGAGDQTLTTGGVTDARDFYHLTVNKSAGTLTLATNDLDVDGNLNVTAGKLDLSTLNATVTGTLTVTGELLQTSGNLVAGGITVATAGSWLNESIGGVTLGTGGVNNSGYLRLDSSGNGGGQADAILIRSSAAGTQRPWVGGGTFLLFDVDVQDQAGTATITVYNGTNFGNNGANWLFDVATGAYKFWDGGGADTNWSTVANWSGDTAPASTSWVVFDGTNDKSCTINANASVDGMSINLGYGGTVTQSAGMTLTVGGSGYTQGAATFAGGNSAIDLNGGFSLTSGSFTATSGITSLSGNLTVSGGTFAHNNGTITFDGASGQTVNIGSVALNNVTLNKGSTSDLTVTGDMDVNGTLTVTQVRNIDTGIILAGGNVTTTDTAVGGTGLIKLDGAGSQTLGAGGSIGALSNVTIDKGAATLTTQDTVNIGGNLIITSVATFNSTGSLNLAGGLTSTDASVAGTCAITLNGTVDQTITATGADLPDGTLTINKGTGIAYLGSALSLGAAGQDLTVAAGTLDLNNYALTVNDTLTNNGSLLAKGAGTPITAGTLATTSSTSNVDYTGSAADGAVTVKGGTYGSFKVDNSGTTFTLNGATTIQGNLSITTGSTLDVSASNYGLTAQGNWSNSGTFIPRSGTVTFNGTNQGVTGTATFYGLTKTATVADTFTLPAGVTITVSGNLTLQGPAKNNPLAIRSGTGGTKAKLTLSIGGVQSLLFLDVKDNDASGGLQLIAYDSVDSTNNLNWAFQTLDVTTGLVAYWKLDNSAADAAGTNNGTVTGAAFSTTSSPTSYSSTHSATFDGLDDIITVPDAASLNMTGAITLAAWVKSSSTSKVIIGGYGINPYPGYGLGVDASGKLRYWSSTHGSWVSGSSAVNDNNWHHVAISISGTTVTFYKDGSSDGTATSATPGSYNGIRALGAAASGADYLSGSLDEMRIYSRALNSTEIAGLAAKGGAGVLTLKDTDPPNSATATNSTSVKAVFTGLESDATAYVLSNTSGSFGATTTIASPVPATLDATWILSSGDGEKTVYARISRGTATYDISDTITLDATPPSVPTGLTLTANSDNTAITAAVTAPSSSDVTKLIFRYNALDGNVAPSYPASATAGTAFGTGSVSNVTASSSQSLVASSLTQLKTYGVAVWAEDTAGNVSSTAAQASLYLSPPTPRLVITAPSSATSAVAGSSLTLTITAKDANGSVISTYAGPYSLTWAPTGGTASTIVSSSSSGWSAGVTTASTTIGGSSAGAGTFTATDESGSSLTNGTLAFTFYPSSFTVSADAASLTAGKAFTLTVTAVDSAGSTVTRYAGTISLSLSATPTATKSLSSTSLTASSGVASASLTYSDCASSVTITAKDTTYVTGITIEGNSSTLKFAPSKFSVTVGNPPLSRTVFYLNESWSSVKITAQGYDGVTTPNFRGTVTFTAVSGLSLPANYVYTASDAGVREFTGISATAAGSYTLAVSDTATTSATGSSGTVTVVAAKVVVANVSGPVGTLSVPVKIVDPVGNLIHDDVTKLYVTMTEQTANSTATTPLLQVAFKTGQLSLSVTDSEAETVTISGTTTPTLPVTSGIVTFGSSTSTYSSSFQYIQYEQAPGSYTISPTYYTTTTYSSPTTTYQQLTSGTTLTASTTYDTQVTSGLTALQSAYASPSYTTATGTTSSVFLASPTATSGSYTFSPAAFQAATQGLPPAMAASMSSYMGSLSGSSSGPGSFGDFSGTAPAWMQGPMSSGSHGSSGGFDFSGGKGDFGSTMGAMSMGSWSGGEGSTGMTGPAAWMGGFGGFGAEGGSESGSMPSWMQGPMMGSWSGGAEGGFSGESMGAYGPMSMGSWSGGSEGSTGMTGPAAWMGGFGGFGAEGGSESGSMPSWMQGPMMGSWSGGAEGGFSGESMGAYGPMSMGSWSGSEGTSGSMPSWMQGPMMGSWSGGAEGSSGMTGPPSWMGGFSGAESGAESGGMPSWMSGPPSWMGGFGGEGGAESGGMPSWMGGPSSWMGGASQGGGEEDSEGGSTSTGEASATDATSASTSTTTTTSTGTDATGEGSTTTE